MGGTGMPSRDMKTVTPGDSVQNVFCVVQSLRGSTVVLWLARLPPMAGKIGKQFQAACQSRSRAAAALKPAAAPRERGSTVQFRVPSHLHPQWGSLRERRYAEQVATRWC